MKTLQQVMMLSIVACAALAGATTHATDIHGAGATFPAPIYTQWADAYRRETGTVPNREPPSNAITSSSFRS